MMDTFKNILVVIDPLTDDQKALKRALEIASKTSARITAFLTIFDLSYEMTTMLSSTERDVMRESVINNSMQWLQDLVLPLESNKQQIKCKVVWHNRPFESIISEVFDQKIDLVVKGTHQHDKLKSVIFTPTDWHLLRKCPCPLLLVKEHLWPIDGKILAAINPGSETDAHQDLNIKIVEQSIQLATLIKAEVNLVNAYPGTPVNLSIEIPEFNVTHYNDTMLKHHKNAMSKIANKFHMEENNCYIKEGLPEDVIEAVANKLDAELVVLGTIGRTGLSAAFIGNTAEHVIDKLNCDVLAIKPDGYISPLA